MTTWNVRISLIAGLLLLAPAGRASADVCVTVDESRDTLSSSDRVAALLVLGRQFELAGERVVADGCGTPYLVSHVALGTTISVTLSGPKGQRDATALGLDDLPAIYSQMVRSLLSGRPMDARGVVDRTNVSGTQATTSTRRVDSDSVAYARLGYGALFGDSAYGGPSVGVFGYRKELDSFGIDVSFLNLQYKTEDGYGSYGYGGSGSSGFTGSWLKLVALHFQTPRSDRSLYYGGGFSWAGTNLQRGNTWSHGSGLQGELTAGYELGRASTIRVFLQADGSLPFYQVHSETYTSYGDYLHPPTVVTDHRYVPSLALSLGLGWQRGGRK